MKYKIKYIPNEKQEIFHSSDADEVVYGGAKGGGKSKALVMECIAFCMENKGAEAYLFRETYDDLEANIISEFKKSLPKELYGYNESKHFATLINGSKVFFRYIANDNDADGYQGRSMDFIGIDELTKHSEKAVQVLLSCLRSVKFKPKFKATCNPGGKGHQWVKDRYIDATEKGHKIITDNVTGNTIQFIPATVYDNTTLMNNDPAYVRRLENLPDAQKKAFLEGDWDIFDGQYFEDWNYETHTCIPFQIPKTWATYTTMDYGLDMFAHYRIALSPKGDVYVTHELYESGLIVSEACNRIKNQETDEPLTRIAPPDLWNRQAAIGKSTSDLFAENGLLLTKANNDRIAGWLAIKELMKVTDELQEDGSIVKKSKLHIFRNCKNLIRSLPALQYSDKNPSDTANEPHEITHAPDALRYFAISYTYPNEERKIKKYASKVEKFFEMDYNEEETTGAGGVFGW